MIWVVIPSLPLLPSFLAFQKSLRSLLISILHPKYYPAPPHTLCYHAEYPAVYVNFSPEHRRKHRPSKSMRLLPHVQAANQKRFNPKVTQYPR
jgi:hypothetical protein